jgi:hypothetical protein
VSYLKEFLVNLDQRGHRIGGATRMPAISTQRVQPCVETPKGLPSWSSSNFRLTPVRSLGASSVMTVQLQLGA